VLLILTATFRIYLLRNCERKLKGRIRYLGVETLTLFCCSKLQIGRRSDFCTKVNSYMHNLESKGEKMQDQETHETQSIKIPLKKPLIPELLMY